ncbi:hypothetical protein EJB05_52377, partial [Eragrostis curvula]
MRRLVPLLLLFSSTSLLTATSEYVEPIHFQCVSNTNYTRGSAFQANLDAVLSSLPSAAASSLGFAKNATGAPVAFLAKPKEDAAAEGREERTASSKCVEKMARKLRSECLGLTSAIAVSGTCLLRHSNVSFFGEGESSFLGYNHGAAGVAQPELFATRLDALMNNLTRMAAYGNPRLFAVGVTEHTALSKIYGMAQCTGDLSPDDCYKCLNRGVYYITTNWNREKGGQSVLWSCYLRFESAIFYNLHAAEAIMSTWMAPVLAPGDGRSPNHGDQSGQRSATGAGSNLTVRTALLVSVPVAVTLLVLLIVAVYTCKKNRKLHKHGLEDEEMGGLESLRYDLSTLQAATENFSEKNKLGQGGFGPVYKGTLQNGQNIAVKRLSTESKQGQAEMKNEVVLVAKLQHKNLVRLLGYCTEQNERLLVYEFLSNMSLDKLLYGPARQQEISWAQRYRIIEGVGRGLMYLHEDSRLKIIHRDLEPGNILLDADMNPKISDFGLAKLFNIDSSVKNTRHNAGTYGYMAPKHAKQCIVSDKSDVFSYGVLVLEIITRRRPCEDLIKFVWRHWHQGSMTQLVDGCPADEHEKQEILRCIHIGLLCVQDDAQLRPRMAAVVHMLNSRPMTLALPAEPVFEVPGERPRLSALEPRKTISAKFHRNIRHFAFFAWSHQSTKLPSLTWSHVNGLSVSRTLDLKRLLKDMLFQINGQDYQKAEMWEAEQLIHNHKRCPSIYWPRYLEVVFSHHRKQKQPSPAGPAALQQPSPGAMSSLLAFFLLLCSLILAAPAYADDPFYTDCPSNTNYTRGSEFQTNLDALLSSLTSAAATVSSRFAEKVTGCNTLTFGA